MSRTTELLAGGVALLVVAGATGWYLMDRAGSQSSAAGTSPTRSLALDDTDDPPKRDKFGEDRVAAKVDGERAIKYVKQLIDIGPRVSGTEGMAKQQALLIKHFEDLGAKVTKQQFKARQRSQRTDVAMTNLIVSWFPARKSRVIFCSHYDSRPAAHEEPNPANWKKTFDSANDGTSGVALFMELAHHMKDFPTGVGVDFVLFDGEEYILDPGTPGLGNGDKFFFGSEYFGADYAKNKAKLPYKYEAAILLDLFGHGDARIAVEGYSWKYAPKLVNEVWAVAAAVGTKSFKSELGFARSENVLDDHIALNEAGIPAIDIIDFDYKHWHLLSDTADKVSPKQLAEVGTVLLTWLSTKKN